MGLQWGVGARRGQHGFSLNELLIAIAISGTLSLAIVGLLINTNQTSAQIARQSEHARETEDFIYALEQYVGQLVQLVRCNCDTDATPCNNQSLVEAPNYSASPVVPVMRFVVENAVDPMIDAKNAAANCIYTDLDPIDGSTITPRGCKQLLELRYTRPQATNGAIASQPGELSLVWTLPDTPPNSVAGTVLARLTNVTRFACTMTAPTGQLSNSEMLFNIETKTRVNNINVPTASGYETWSPNDIAAYAPTFNWGLHRKHSVEVSFRNLITPGIQFGKIQRMRNCVENGLAANSFTDCCSDYRNATTGLCIAQSACKHNPGDGTTAVASYTPSAGAIDECCSHMTTTLSGATVCL